jgi:hypothetical protein
VAAAAVIKHASAPYGTLPSFFHSLSADFTRYGLLCSVGVAVRPAPPRLAITASVFRAVVPSRKRDALLDALATAGLRPITPDGELVLVFVFVLGLCGLEGMRVTIQLLRSARLWCGLSRGILYHGPHGPPTGARQVPGYTHRRLPGHDQVGWGSLRRCLDCSPAP